MKVGLIGFGKTGKAVASVILKNNNFSLEWVLRKTDVLEHRNASEFLGINSEDPGMIYSLKSTSLQKLMDQNTVDVIIDFSSNEGIHHYGTIASKKKITIISAISEYGEQELTLLNELSKNSIVFWSPNITFGVNYLLYASKFLKKIAPWADIEIVEEHFKQKKGVSGTALKLAETLDINKTQINSVRAGGIIGKHEVIFGFPFQTVRLTHESISREAFGSGVVFVAENLINKDNGLYTFEDLLQPYFAT